MTDIILTLDALSISNEALKDLDTRLSQKITEIEELLRKHISTRIALNIGECVVAFGKIEGKWHLIVDNTPLLSCSRETRVQMMTAGHIESLIRSAPTQLDEQIASRKAAIITADQIMLVLSRS